MVIYRPEPSPSLTPLLRNYTQSVANKSKKVSGGTQLVRLHTALSSAVLASSVYVFSLTLSFTSLFSCPTSFSHSHLYLSETSITFFLLRSHLKPAIHSLFSFPFILSQSLSFLLLWALTTQDRFAQSVRTSRGNSIEILVQIPCM